MTQTAMTDVVPGRCYTKAGWVQCSTMCLAVVWWVRAVCLSCCTKGKTDLGHFWFTNFWVSDPLSPTAPLFY